MKTSEKVNISLRKLVGLPNNPRKITQADLNKLCDSIRNKLQKQWQADWQAHRQEAFRRIQMKRMQQKQN